MNARFHVVTASAFLLAVMLSSFSFWLCFDQPGIPSLLISIPINLLAGTFGFVAFSYRLQTRSRSSRLSMALIRHAVTKDLLIGSIACEQLLKASAASPGAGPHYVEEMERLAVSHNDRMRLGLDTDIRMTSISLDPQGSIAEQRNGRPATGSLSVAVDDEHFVIRRGEPDEPVAIIDGKDRLLIIRHQIPAAMRQAMVERSRSGPFPLSSIVDLSSVHADCEVEGVHLGGDEVHLLLAPRLMRWSNVRDELDPDYRRAHTPSRRLLAVLRSAWRIGS